MAGRKWAFPGLQYFGEMMGGEGKQKEVNKDKEEHPGCDLMGLWTSSQKKEKKTSVWQKEGENSENSMLFKYVTNWITNHLTYVASIKLKYT